MSLKHTKSKLAICLCLCFSLIFATLSGCSGLSSLYSDGGDSSSSGSNSDTTESQDGGAVYNEETSLSDSLFTLCYNSQYTFNPLTCENPFNIAVTQLMFEGLFVLNKNFEAEPVLCEEYSTADGITYSFTIKDNVYFHDGTKLSADDVVYTLNVARSSSKYGSRLSPITGISVTGELTFTITLASANYNFPVLLDVPIVKSGSADNNCPIGTGPYEYISSSSSYLKAYSGYRDYSALPIKDIYLSEVPVSELTESFSSGLLDLVPLDPTGTVSLNLQLDCEVRYSNTTILQYVGFNMDNSVLAVSEVRRAISHAIDKNYIADTIMSGHALAAPIALNSALSYYDSSWEEGLEYSIQTLSSIFINLGMDDYDSDGFLEYPNQGSYSDLKINFIVNEDNSYKVAAAEEIVSDLNSVGIDITLNVLPWAEYTAALAAGEFDMYYAEVQLPADFDLSELLAADGSLNYGKISDTEYLSLISAFLSSPDETASASSGKALCDYIYQNSPIIPIVYKQYSIISHRNVISGISPTQSSIFYGLTNWAITMK